MRACVSCKVGLVFNDSAPSTFRKSALSTDIIPGNINKITSLNFPSNFKVSEVEKFDLWYYNWLPSSERNGFAQQIFSLQRSHFLSFSLAVFRTFFLPFVLTFKATPPLELSYRRQKENIFWKWKDLAFKILFKSDSYSRGGGGAFADINSLPKQYEKTYYLKSYCCIYLFFVM